MAQDPFSSTYSKNYIYCSFARRFKHKHSVAFSSLIPRKIKHVIIYCKTKDHMSRLLSSHVIPNLIYYQKNIQHITYIISTCVSSHRVYYSYSQPHCHQLKIVIYSTRCELKRKSRLVTTRNASRMQECAPLGLSPRLCTHNDQHLQWRTPFMLEHERSFRPDCLTFNKNESTIRIFIRFIRRYLSLYLLPLSFTSYIYILTRLRSDKKQAKLRSIIIACRDNRQCRF